MESQAARDGGLSGAATTARGALSRGAPIWQFLRTRGIFLALMLLVIAGTALSPHFLTTGNLATVARQASIYGILGVGMTFVILTAGIDLSVGSILGFVAVTFAYLMASGLVWPLAMLVALVAGAGVGALNGLGITRGRLQPFIMTLGMLVIARGVTMTVANGKPIPFRQAAEGVAWLGNGTFLGIPVPLLLFVAIALAAWFTLRYTPFGRQIYAVGDNLEAARLSGIRTNRVIFSAYVLSGLCAAVAALIVVTRLSAAEPTMGEGYELDAIAIVVIGGTSLFGGDGGIGGTVIGAAIVQGMSNLLNLLGIPPFTQLVVKGLIILGAVFLERRAVKGEGR